ncbi:DegT/DnrJ/EryC1/StrS family aminotransferase [Calditrichota bacterium GD2]
MAKLAINGGTAVRTLPYPLWPVYDEREKQLLLKVLESRQWGRIGGAMNEKFEQLFAAFQQARYATTVCNGTIALRIALFAAGVGPGDEVIVPSYTFVATATAVIEANAIPIMADIDLNTFNIDPVAIESLITERTKAIIPVHFGGAPVNMDRIMEIAQKHSLMVIEDAAQAQGSEWRGRRVGAIGHAGTFSFQLSKNMTSGEGGAIVTNDDTIAETIKRFHNCGRKPNNPWYLHFEISGNYRLSEFQAAVLLAQLEREEQNIALRTKNAKYLNELLMEVEGIEPITYPEHVKSSYYLYLCKYQKEAFGGLPKEKFVKALNAEGIPVMEGYPFPLYRQPLFQERKFWKAGCPFSCAYYNQEVDYRKIYHANAEKACEIGLWLPNYVFHGNAADVEHIAEAINKVKQYAHELKE